MTIQFADYEGPSGLYVADGKQLHPLASAVGALVFVGAAAQSGIGDPADAELLQAHVDATAQSLALAG